MALNDIIITPELAAAFLDGDPRKQWRQKAIERFVIYMVDAMKNGEWLPGSCGPILFAADGAILDGVHRLEAVRRSGVATRFLVLTNVEHQVHEPLPYVTPRTARQQARIEAARG